MIKQNVKDRTLYELRNKRDRDKIIINDNDIIFIPIIVIW